MFPAIHRKLLRDLYRLKGQVVTIALVVAAGIAAFVALRGNYGSLISAREAFYERQRFADVFVSLERAPDGVRRRLEAIPGVARVETRVVEAALLPLPQISEPIRARVVSLHDDETLNAIRMHDGRRPEAGHSEEVVVLKAFADAHGIVPGDRIPAVINGKKRDVRVVGTATSPEYVIAIASGSIAADPERFAVLWMSSDVVAQAFRMEGAFNDVALSLFPGASEQAVIEAVDDVLQPYGGFGAVGRSRQLSNYMLDAELEQLSGISTLLPAIFLAVAALLVNVVLSRLVLQQQPEIATLKALGYSNRQVGLHFLELVLVVAGLGALSGVGLGAYFGVQMVSLYERYFDIPGLVFDLDVEGMLTAVSISCLAALAGAGSAVLRVVRMPPAEAMRPPAPARYKRSLFDRLGLGSALGPSVQMILRELSRRPLRAVFSIVAIAASTALSVVGGWYYDGIEILVETQFQLVMREDAAVTFMEPRPERAIRELAHLPGVREAEGLRVVPVRFRVGHRHRDGVIWGYEEGGQMRMLRDRMGAPVELPPEGVVLTDVLAKILDAEVGETIEVEIREGQRETRRVVISGLVDESFGLQGHMSLPALRRWLGEEPLVSMALLRTDPELDALVDERLKDTPFVADVTRRAGVLARFREQSAGMIRTMAIVISLFAATITIGVVYNNARIALSMRSRDLASLRVLGFSRGEVSSVLLGELAIQVLLAIPIGLFLGSELVLLMASMDPENYRLPLIITPKGYAFAALVTLVSAIGSALIVRRRIDRLDLVAVLKTRE